MKKILLFTFACLLVFAGYGQQKANKLSMSQEVKGQAVMTSMQKADDGTVVPILPFNTSRSNSPRVLNAEDGTEWVVGYTKYDLQTNSALANRFFLYQDDLTVGATWTGGLENDAFSDRGSFYNYFDGVEWIYAPEDVTRIEDARQGWPSYGPWGETGEAVFSHPANGVSGWAREVKGEGEWNMITQTVSSPEATWPRYIFSEAGSMHVLDMLATETERALFYSRSKDLGQSWEPQAYVIPQIGPDAYNPMTYAADDYVWAEPNAGVIAFAIFSSTCDLIVMKSYDDGETWEKTVVWEHPIPMFDWTTQAYEDTCVAPNGGGSLAIDEEGKVHVTFPVCAFMFEEPSTNGQHFYFPNWGHILYWNEDMDTFTGTDNQYRALDPFDHEEYFEQNKVIAFLGFDFDGDNSVIAEGAKHSYFRSVGPFSNTHITCAGPERMVIAFSASDERRTNVGEDGETYMVRQTFLCSYKNVPEATKADGYEWVFDNEWISAEDGHMVTQNPNLDYSGFYRVNDFYLHQLNDCVYPQVLSIKGDDHNNMYVFFQYDAVPGIALNSNDPAQTSYTDNTIAMWGNTKDFTGFILKGDGIESETANSSLNIYPNPSTNGKVNIEVENNAKCVIYNVIGQIVAEYDLVAGNNTITVNNLSAGVYVVAVGNKTEKLVVK